MNKGTYKKLEFAGVFICFIFWFLLFNFNSYENGLLIKILFCAVNNSVWESFKLFLFGYILWSAITLCWAKPPLKRFMVAKAISLYFIGASYCLIVPCIYILGYDFNPITHCICIFLASVIFHYSSYKAVCSNLNLEILFLPCLLMLVIFAIIYVGFTPYPLKYPAFFDFTTGCYGLPSGNIDKGALFLDRLYGI